MDVFFMHFAVSFIGRTVLHSINTVMAFNIDLCMNIVLLGFKRPKSLMIALWYLKKTGLDV
jgi:hypothetical protein